MKSEMKSIYKFLSGYDYTADDALDTWYAFLQQVEKVSKQNIPVSPYIAFIERYRT